MKNNILNNWNLFRFIRLAIGLYLLIDGIRTGMWMLIGLGALFTLMPLLNKSCCAASNCNTSTKNSDQFDSEEIIYEEVKSKRR